MTLQRVVTAIILYVKENFTLQNLYLHLNFYTLHSTELQKLSDGPGRNLPAPRGPQVETYQHRKAHRWKPTSTARPTGRNLPAPRGPLATQVNYYCSQLRDEARYPKRGPYAKLTQELLVSYVG